MHFPIFTSMLLLSGFNTQYATPGDPWHLPHPQIVGSSGCFALLHDAHLPTWAPLTIKKSSSPCCLSLHCLIATLDATRILSAAFSWCWHSTLSLSALGVDNPAWPILCLFLLSCLRQALCFIFNILPHFPYHLPAMPGLFSLTSAPLLTCACAPSIAAAALSPTFCAESKCCLNSTLNTLFHVCHFIEGWHFSGLFDLSKFNHAMPLTGLSPF